MTAGSETPAFFDKTYSEALALTEEAYAYLAKIQFLVRQPGAFRPEHQGRWFLPRHLQGAVGHRPGREWFVAKVSWPRRRPDHPAAALHRFVE